MGCLLVKKNRFSNSLSKKQMAHIKSSIEFVSVLTISFAYSLWIFQENLTGLFRNRITLAGDGAATGLYLKTVMDSPWIDVLTMNVRSSNFGWPGSLNFSLYPTGNLIDVLTIKLFGQIFNIHDPENLVHIFSILKAIFISLAAYVAFKSIGTKMYLALPLSVVFATYSFNLVRSEGHFFLGFTWNVALGIATFSYALRSYFKTEENQKKAISKIVSLGFLVGFSTFYFTLFLLVVTGSLFFIIAVSDFVRNRREIAFTSQIKFKIKVICIYLLTIAIGFVYQVLMIILANTRYPSLSKIGERSPIEPIIYSGNIESLFFDSSKVFLKLVNREDLINFLNSRISWEGSQLGSFVGFFMYLLLALLIINKLVRGQARDDSENQSSLLGAFSLFLIICLILYIPSPLNFAISQVVNPIRAWGRISVLISFSVLILIALYLKRANKVIATLGVALIVLMNHSEATMFRNSRPNPTISDLDSRNRLALANETLGEISKLLGRNCSINYLPNYAFPEFDFPYDSVGDYAPLDLLLADIDVFKWSYGAIKNSKDASTYQNSFSDQPDFKRMSIINQIRLGYVSGACASIVDFAMLSEKEIDEIRSTFNKKNLKCIYPLSGMTFNEDKRYYLISFLDNCDWYRPSESITESRLFLENSNNIFYRFRTPYVEKFFGDWVVYERQKSVSFSIMNLGESKLNQLSLGLKIFNVDQEINSTREHLIVCVDIEPRSQEICGRSSYDNSRRMHILRLNIELDSGRVYVLGARLQSVNPKATNWSIRPIVS